MYFAVAKNKQLAKQNNPEANIWADEVKKCFERDSLLTLHYNTEIAGGKWKHMMDQIRIGYTYWQEPKQRVMPEVKYDNTFSRTKKTKNLLKVTVIFPLKPNISIVRKETSE